MQWHCYGEKSKSLESIKIDLLVGMTRINYLQTVKSDCCGNLTSTAMSIIYAVETTLVSSYRFAIIPYSAAFVLQRHYWLAILFGNTSWHCRTITEPSLLVDSWPLIVGSIDGMVENGWVYLSHHMYSSIQLGCHIKKIDHCDDNDCICNLNVLCAIMCWVLLYVICDALKYGW